MSFKFNFFEFKHLKYEPFFNLNSFKNYFLHSFLLFIESKQFLNLFFSFDFSLMLKFVQIQNLFSLEFCSNSNCHNFYINI
jgi:hypothetical protein